VIGWIEPRRKLNQGLPCRWLSQALNASTVYGAVPRD